MEHKSKLAIISGATGGLGRSFAEHLAAQHYHLVLTAYEHDLLDEQAIDLQDKYGITVTTIVADLSKAEDISMLTSYISGLTQIDMLVNCAGYGEKHMFSEEQIGDVRKMLSVHISATVELVHSVLPVMIKNESGAIITVASLAAFIPAPGSSIYASSKAFLNSFMESLHMEVHHKGIQVQSLCPGLTHTGFHQKSDVERSMDVKGIDLWMEPDEVVEASLKGLDKGSVICIPGKINKVIKHFLQALPRGQYYFLTNQVAKKFK